MNAGTHSKQSHERYSATEEFRLSFEPLNRHATAYEFPCDANGNVALDAADDGMRMRYWYARGLIGRDYGLPRINACLAAAAT
jgi:hypothetical protein